MNARSISFQTQCRKRDRARRGRGSDTSSTDLATSMSEIVRRLINEGKVKIEQVAFFTGMSRRTLQRRLAESGQGYSRLVAEMRLARAVTLTGNRSSRFVDVARELGYSDAANFSRAFRRWTGVSPSQFRMMDRKSRNDLMRIGLKFSVGRRRQGAK